MDISPPAMSRHLKALRQSGVVEETHPAFDARVRIYALRPEPMVHLLRWLAETERMWSAQLGAFKAHVEAQSGEGDRSGEGG
jgi:DNA-binding transcriptional ArsR family regulator